MICPGLSVSELTLDSANNTVELPDDFVDWSKVGVVGSDGIVYVLGENKNVNYSQAYANSSGTKVGKASDAADSDGDGVFDRVDSKGATSGTPASSNDISEGSTHTSLETTSTGLQMACTGLVVDTCKVDSE